jgi:TIR domain
MGDPRVFVSYRRDDSAGHAGRLHDGLVARLGAQQVFQDVVAIEPGVDFVDRLEQAIADSDVTLVVIGAGWLAATQPDGTRRIDHEDDYVRREVVAALAGAGRVVPVLVAGTTPPAAEELPEDMQALAQRQAVRLHDETWQEDLDALVRRLREDPGSAVRQWQVAIGVAVVAGAAAVAGWLLLRDGDDEGTETSGAELTGCPLPDPTWQTLEGEPAEPIQVASGVWISVAGAGIRELPGEGEWQVVVQTDAENRGMADGWRHEASIYSQLLVDRVPYGPPTCFSSSGDLFAGADDDILVDQGERSLGAVGYELPLDPTGHPMQLELSGGQRAPVTGG